MPSIINATTVSGVAITGDNSGNLAIQTNNGNTAVTINTSLGVQVANCLGVGNATPSTSGAGITFPATQSASTDANTLDDYEEGTWTPTLNGSITNPTVTYTNQAGIYTKVGNLVTVSFSLQWSATTGGGGLLFVGGLPFTTTSSVSLMGGGSVAYAEGITRNALLYADGGTGRLVLVYTNTNNDFADVPDLAGTGLLIGGMSYRVA